MGSIVENKPITSLNNTHTHACVVVVGPWRGKSTTASFHQKDSDRVAKRKRNEEEWYTGRCFVDVDPTTTTTTTSIT